MSAILKDGIPELVIDEVASRQDIFRLAHSELVGEYLALISRPKLKIRDVIRARWKSLIREDVTVVRGFAPEITFDRDPNDVKVLWSAIVSRADYVVTGDRDFADAPDLGGTHIVTPRGFAGVLKIG